MYCYLNPKHIFEEIYYEIGSLHFCNRHCVIKYIEDLDLVKTISKQEVQDNILVLGIETRRKLSPSEIEDHRDAIYTAICLTR